MGGESNCISLSVEPILQGTRQHLFEKGISIGVLTFAKRPSRFEMDYGCGHPVLNYCGRPG